MEQRFEAVQQEAQAAGASGRQAVQEHSGPCGYHWQRSYARNGPGEVAVCSGMLLEVACRVGCVSLSLEPAVLRWLAAQLLWRCT